MAAIIPVKPAIDQHSSAKCNDSTAIILADTFIARKKSYKLHLSAGKLVWERHKTTSDRTIVPIENILSVKPDIDKTAESVQENHANAKQFIIFYAKRMVNASNPNKWRQFSQTFQHNDSQVCQLWIQAIQQQLNEHTTRPKRLLLFVNPYGGKKRALHIYNDIVKPIFQIVDIDASVVISQRSNQVRDFIMTQSLEHFDGIVCIGGDGTFSEVFNGLIFRTFKDAGLNETCNLDELPKIDKPIGIIPAGSTDTVAYCLNGTCDIRTTVLNIALGQLNGLDLSSVSNQNGLLKFYASVMSYGFLGDVAIESEKFRWMGPKRYDYSGFKKLLLNRGYDGEISMMCAPSADNPMEGPICHEDCKKCTEQNKSDEIPMAVIKSSSEHKFKRDNNNEQNKSGQRYRTVAETALNDTANDQLQTITGKFFMVNCANISCACPRSPNGFSKYCHLCDGYIDLILVRHTTFLNNLRFLLAMSSRNCKIADLSHVEIYRTKRFTFRPAGLSSSSSTFNVHSSRVPISTINESIRTSVWNCDGEVIQESDISIRSHKGLITVYRRGLYNAENEDESSEPSCCC